MVKGGQKDLLGDSTAKRLGVLKIGLNINHLESPLKPFNKIMDVQAHIRMNPHFKPVFQPLRRVPIPMEEAVNKKLDQLLTRDIIEVKTGPSTWVSPLVIVGKASGEPRICLDLRSGACRRFEGRYYVHHQPRPFFVLSVCLSDWSQLLKFSNV